MLAENIMITDLVTANDQELVSHVFDRMREAKLRMLPILDKDNHVLGVLSTFHVMQSIIPDYVASGDLEQISFVPDIGILRKKYKEIIDLPIHDIMDTSPLLVHANESLLSVAAGLSTYGKHEYAIVVDHNNCLLGVVSAGDILDKLKDKASEVNNA